MDNNILRPSGRSEPRIPLTHLLVTPRVRFGLSINEVLGRLFTRPKPRPTEELIEEVLDRARPTDTSDYEVGPPAPLRLHDGVDYTVEEQADDYLKAHKGTQRDWLTKEQLALRIAKEVFNENGWPDGRLIMGMYRRTHNPLFGQRPSKTRRSDE